MAQEVTLMGATYSDVPSILLPDSNSTLHQFTDVTGTTATASDVASGKIFFASDGTETTGTASGGSSTDFVITFTQDSNDVWIPDKTLSEIAEAYSDGKRIVGYVDPSVGSCASIEYYDSDCYLYYQIAVFVADATYPTASNTYYESYIFDSNGAELDESYTKYDTYAANASTSDVVSGKIFLNASGYAVGTASSGSSSWTLVASTSYQVSTTSTSAATVTTFDTGDTSIWTSDAFIYVRIRDTAGKRAGYFYGSDIFFVNYLPVNSSTTTSLTAGTFGMCYRYTTSSTFASRYAYGTTGYGVYADQITSSGNIRIRSRYNSSYSLTVDGTYSVEVYKLTPPSAIFA